MKIFLDTLRRHRLRPAGFFVLYAALAVVISAAELMAIKMTGDISQAALELDTAIMLRFLGLMTAFTAVKAVAAAVSAYRACRFKGVTGHRLRQSFVAHFTAIGLKDLDGKSSGRGLSLFTNELPTVERFLAATTPQLVSGVLSTVATFVFMALIRPVETLIFFLMFPLLVWLQAWISKPIQQKAMTVSAARGDFNAIVQDSLQNTAIVAAYSLETAMEARYLASYDRYYKANMDYLRTLMVLVMSGILATMLPTLFIFIAAGLQVARGQMTIGVFVTFTSVAGIAGNWLSMLSQNLRDLRMGMAGSVKMNGDMADSPEDVTTGTNHMAGGGPAIELEGVSFAYEAGTPILRDVTLTIWEGERVAIVGGSGSGKSTVLKLMLALYEHGGGTIRVRGTDIREASRQALRRCMAYVPQDSFMFPGTIRENLVPPDGQVGRDALESACRRAGIADFIAGLPQGLDTVLTESADNISGGQRQRLAIARALLREADILLLDEATSALDPVTERAVLEGVAAGGGTVVMVAHRRTAIAACDRIILMENGRVAGMGTHAQLMAQSPAYQALYESFDDREVTHESH